VLRPSKVAASSVHLPASGYTYDAENLIDGAVETSWQPAKKASGDVWIRFDYDAPITVTSIAIANGFQTNDRFGDEFLLNRRIAKGVIVIGSVEVPIEFESSTRSYVHFAIPKATGSTIEIRIKDTHPGSKFNDLAVSEIEVSGTPASRTVAAEVPTEKEQWWNAPQAARKDVVALAHGFAGLDENDLGTMYTADLTPLNGAPNLFESKPARRVPRDEMQHLVVKLRQSLQMNAGFNYLFLKAGGSYERERDYQLVRAMQVHEVVRVDETARMHEPPRDAVFYLAEVHLGASFDLLIDGEFSSMGAKLEAAFAAVGGTLESVHKSSAYRMHAFGLGLRDTTGEGIFAMTPEQITTSYRTGTPVPVELVFRTIPGRTFTSHPIKVPEPVVDAPSLAIGEDAFHSYNLPAGKYRVKMSSRPNGVQIEWEDGASCSENLGSRPLTAIDMTCTVDSAQHLKLTNPTTFGLGPQESVSIYVERLK
jgi:hypothetical protein